jgi:carboxylate-amine ligase
VLQATGCIEDYTRIWWDVRPHPRLGTVETRIMDAVARLDDVVALAALVQCLVRHYTDRHAAGDEPALPHPALVAENKWRAIRWGLAAELVDLEAESARRVPVTRLVGRLLRRLTGVAEELGCRAELDGVRRILEQGNGAARQLLVFSANGDPIEVARDIADQTAAL